MGDFHIWGRVEHIGPSEFFVIASAVPDDQASRPIVLTLTAHSLAQANNEKERLMVEVGATVRKRGDRVVDVED